MWCIVGGILLAAAAPALAGEGWGFFASATAIAAGALLVWPVRIPAALLLIVSVSFAAQVVHAVLTTQDNRRNSNAVPRATP